MPIPLVAMAAASLAGKLAQGFFKGKAEKKRGEALNKAAGELRDVRAKQWDAGQARRGAKLGGVQGALKSLGGALPAGAPDYSFDPKVLEAMQAALPYGETAGSLMKEVAGDQKAGSTFGMLSNLGGGIASAADQAMLGQAGGGMPMPGQDGGGMPPTPMALPAATDYTQSVFEGTPAGGSAGSVEGDIDWDEILKQRG